MALGCLTCVPTKISPYDFQEETYNNNNENGFYKFEKTENLKEFFKAEGFPDHVINKTLRNMEIYWKATATDFEMIQWFGSAKISASGRFAEEVSHTVG